MNSPQIPPQLRAWRDHATAIMLYLGLALGMTWPLALQMTTAVPGNGFDTWQNMWNMWWLREALLTGSNPYFTPYLYYPHGASLLLQTLNPINFIISLPVHALFGLVVAYNFVVIFSLTMSGYTTFLLARAVLAETDLPSAAQRRAALVGGVAFAFSGYLLAQIMGSHTHMLAAWPLPLAVLALWYAARSQRPWQIALAGLLIALTLLADWQYLLFTLIWAAWYAASRLFTALRAAATTPGRWDWRTLWPHVQASGALAVSLAVGLALLLILPLVVATAQFAATVPSAETEGGPNFRLEHSADLADFFIPSQLHPLLGPLAEQLQAYKAETHIQNKTVYLGFTVLVLALFGAGLPGGSFWLLSALLFAILAMGPQLQIAGWLTGIPLPGAILYELPLVGISRYPMRFAVYTTLALAILAALGAGRMFAALRQPAAQYSQRSANLALVGLIALLTFEQLTTPFPIIAVYIPPIYAELGQDEAQYAILEAPFYYNSSPTYMLFQIAHGKYLVGGYTSRRLPYPLLEQIPLMRMYAYAQPAPDIIVQDDQALAASIFSYFDIRYLMLHSAGGALHYAPMRDVALAAAANQAPRTELSLLRYSDARRASGLLRAWTPFTQPSVGSVLAYRIVPPTDPQPFLGLGAGWSPPTERADGAGVERQMQHEAEMLVFSAQPQTATLHLDVVSPSPGRLELLEADTPLASFELRPGPAQQQVALTIPAGTTTLRLRYEGDAALVVRALELQDVREGQ